MQRDGRLLNDGDLSIVGFLVREGHHGLALGKVGVSLHEEVDMCGIAPHPAPRLVGAADPSRQVSLHPYGRLHGHAASGGAYDMRSGLDEIAPRGHRLRGHHRALQPAVGRFDDDVGRSQRALVVGRHGGHQLRAVALQRAPRHVRLGHPPRGIRRDDDGLLSAVSLEIERRRRDIEKERAVRVSGSAGVVRVRRVGRRRRRRRRLRFVAATAQKNTRR